MSSGTKQIWIFCLTIGLQFVLRIFGLGLVGLFAPPLVAILPFVLFTKPTDQIVRITTARQLRRSYLGLAALVILAILAVTFADGIFRRPNLIKALLVDAVIFGLIYNVQLRVAVRRRNAIGHTVA